MPVLLASDSAPSLIELLETLKQRAGLDWTLPVGANQLDYHEQPICGLGSLAHASEVELSFLANPKFAEQLHTTKAGAVFLRPLDLKQLQEGASNINLLQELCAEAYFAYAVAVQWFDQHRLQHLPPGIHPLAVIDPDAQLEPGVSVGPHAVIEAGCQIGRGARIEAGCHIGKQSRIGAHSHLYPRVVLYHGTQVGERCIIHSGAVIGADGFGFAPDPVHQGQWAKIAQLGQVQIGNDVEIGANTTIDRGALDNTVIHDGVKLDNQIMVAHNVEIGAHTAVAACVGIAGSTKIGARCIIGGAAMISGHLEIVDDVQVSGGTAVTGSVRQPERLTGVYPFQEHKQWQRNAAVISQLSHLRKRVRALERTLEALEK